MPEPRRLIGPGLVAFALLATSSTLVVLNLSNALPAGRWIEAVFSPNLNDMRELVVHYSALPRVAVALLCGGGLGLAGALLQQVLRNPLADPGTLGVFAGARFALFAATLWAPELLAFGYEPLALVGGGVSMAIVLALSRGRGFAPTAVVLAGMIVSLGLEAANKMLTIGNFETLSDLLIWQAGSLSQNDWSAAAQLAPRIALAAAAASLIARPLGLLELEDAGARSLGARLAVTRFAAVALAVLVSASVVGTVGAIGFIGLAGSAVARAAGARTIGSRLLWGAAVSAGMLALTDQALVFATGGTLPPAGAATALLGAPLLLWLVWRFRSTAPGERMTGIVRVAGSPHAWTRFLILIACMALAAWLAMALGRTPEGWRWSTGAELFELSTWRGPRVAGSMAAGFMLSIAGAVLQRISGNPMASPELLGVSSGAAIMLLIAAFFLPTIGYGGSLALAALGGFAALSVVLAIGRRSAFAPMQTLLIGVGLSALLGSISELVLITGDPRVSRILTWLAGSTYSVTPGQAVVSCAAATIAALALPLAARALAILPLGDSPATAVGLNVGRSRLALLVYASTLTALSTLLVGPLSFVGLMAPHLARLSGARGPLSESLTAGMLGALLMVLADWLGRQIAFPWQIPAGVVATAIGGLYFVWLMKMKR
ncbi:MAG: Fe(3+)-hydroxamate ABC transporter permease FhuB [Hansschlegelia sp.]